MCDQAKVQSLLDGLTSQENSDMDIMAILTHALCVHSENMGMVDPLNYARLKEVLMADALGHTLSSGYSGEDAFNERGESVEYKCSTSNAIKANYSGLSVQPTWRKQIKYLVEKKIKVYPWHYAARFKGANIVEAYELSGEVVLQCLLPKIKRRYDNRKAGKVYADPRLSGELCQREIRQHGTKLI